jgi:hypothetical protein
LKNNSLSFLINQLTGAIGKREITDSPKDIATDFLIDNILNPLINDLMTGTNNFLLQNGGLIGLIGSLIGKREATETPKGLATDFLVDNILNPLVNDLMTGTNNFLLQNGGLIGLLGSLIGKRESA